MSGVFLLFDYIGTFVFATTGASIGARLKFDFFGMLFLGFLTAVGGGTVRDLIISQPVFWTENPAYLYLVFVATLMSFFLDRYYERLKGLLLFLDTLGLGMFAVIGTQKSMSLGFNFETALIMGAVTAVLGGILRSAFSRELSILHNKEVYATVAAASSLLYLL